MCFSKGNLQGLGTVLDRQVQKRFFYEGARGRERPGKLLPVLQVPTYLCSPKAGAVGCCPPPPLSPPLPWQQRTRPPRWCRNPLRCTRSRRPTTLRAAFYLLGYPWKTRCLWRPGSSWLQEKKAYLLSERRVGGVVVLVNFSKAFHFFWDHAAHTQCPITGCF